MDKQISTRKAAAIALCCIVFGAALCLFGILSYFGGWGGLAAAQKFSAINQVIDEYYIGEYESDKITDAAFSALISELGDDWSYYMSADEYADYLETSSNQMSGIGVTIMLDEETGYMKIMSVMPDTPAERAGLKPNETIVAIAGKDIIGLDMSEVRERIRDHADENFSINVLDENGVEREVTLAVETISITPVTHELRDDDVGYIRISNFSEGAADAFEAAVNELVEDGAIGLVIDVRTNPGGRVTQVSKMLDLLLPECEIFISVDESGTETVTSSDEDFIDIPVVVLIDANSYSAAEFFAAALSEYGRAVTVGEQTTGKSRSQITVELSDGSAVHISSAAYLTPNRVDLAEIGGITPDIEVGITDEGDAQVDAAVKTILEST